MGKVLWVHLGLNMKISDGASSFLEPMRATTSDKVDRAATESGPRSHDDKAYSDGLSGDDDDFWYEELDRDSNKDHSR